MFKTNVLPESFSESLLILYCLPTLSSPRAFKNSQMFTYQKYLSLSPDTLAKYQTTYSASHLMLTSSQISQLNMSGTPGQPPNSPPHPATPKKICSFSTLPHLSKWYLQPKNCISKSFFTVPTISSPNPIHHQVFPFKHYNISLHSHRHHLN